MEIAAIIIAVTLLVGIILWSFHVVTKEALNTLNRNTVFSQEQICKFATDALEIVKAQSITEKASVDFQREFMDVPLEEQESPKIEVKTVDGRVVDLAGSEWEIV